MNDLTITNFDLLNIKTDSANFALPTETDYRLRKAFSQAGLDDAFATINARRQRLQELRESCALEIDSILAVATILFEHEHLDGVSGYLELFKSEVLDRELEIPAYQISRILGAAKVKAQAKASAVATDQEKKLVADMSLNVAYEYSKLNLPERRTCLSDHIRKELEPSKRSVMRFKQQPQAGAKKVAPPQPQLIAQPGAKKVAPPLEPSPAVEQAEPSLDPVLVNAVLGATGKDIEAALELKIDQVLANGVTEAAVKDFILGLTNTLHKRCHAHRNIDQT